MKTTLPLAALLTACFCLASGCGKKEAAAVQITNNSSGNPITAPVDYLGGIAKAKKLAEKTADTASLTSAIQLFYGQEDRYPKDLNELIQQHYIQSLPKAPYGMKVTYDPTTGKVGYVYAK